MKAAPLSISELFLTERFNIPLYQRHYRWNESLCSALWEDFQRLLDRDGDDHYLGTLVVERAGDALEIIDGQQRVTSLMLLIRAFQLCGPEWLSALRRFTHAGGAIRLTPQELGQEPGQEPGQESDLKTFARLMAEDPDVIEREGKMVDNLAFFRKWIAERQADSPVSPGDVVSVLERMSLAFVILNDDREAPDDVHKVFDRMNGNGKNLEVHDLIRNYLFMLAAEAVSDPRDEEVQTASAKQRSLHFNEWQNVEREFPERGLEQMKHFFRDYLILETGDVKLTSGKDLYAAFKEHTVAKLSGRALVFREVEGLVNDIWKYADAWGKVVFGNPLHGKSQATADLRAALMDFGTIATAPYHQFGTLLMLDYGSDPKSHHNLAVLFGMLSRFIVLADLAEENVGFARRFLAQVLLDRDSVKRFREDPSTLADELKKLLPDGFDVGKALDRALLGKADEVDPETGDDSFELGVEAQTADPKDGSADEGEREAQDGRESSAPPDIYHRNRRIVLFLLLKINEHLMEKEGDTLTRFHETGHTLEHVIPQTLTKDWKGLEAFQATHLHSIGNLTLLGRGYNSQVSNRSLAEKRNYYRNSSYTLTRHLANGLGGLMDGEKEHLKNLPGFIGERAGELCRIAKEILNF